MAKVTDADREAAAGFFRDERTPLSVKFNLGYAPGPLLEAFARHRIAGAKAALEAAAKAMRSVEPDTEAAGCEATWGDFQQVAEDAIRNIDPEECE